jgi:hypothetical protein
MYVRRRTWIDHTRRRGVGAAGCPSLAQLQGIADASDPCQSSSGGCFLTDGTPAPCPDVTSMTVTASAGSGFCFSPAFPWFGQSAAGVCVPVFSVPSPWGMAISIGLVGLVAFRALGGRR